jgi:hypothetical protein
MDNLAITTADVSDKNLLLRFLSKVVNSVTNLDQRLARVEQHLRIPTQIDPASIRNAIQANGTAPLNVENMLGRLAQPQAASIMVFESTPSGLQLQSLKGGEIYLISSTSTATPWEMWRVTQGNPNTATQVVL